MRETYTGTSGETYTECDTANEWPDWEGIDSCECGADLPDDCYAHCEQCGYWLPDLVARRCADCGDPLSGTYYCCLDGGDNYCSWCYTKIKRQDTRQRRADRRALLVRVRESVDQDCQVMIVINTHGLEDDPRYWVVWPQGAQIVLTAFDDGYVTSERRHKTVRGAFYAMAHDAGLDTDLALR